LLTLTAKQAGQATSDSEDDHREKDDHRNHADRARRLATAPLAQQSTLARDVIATALASTLGPRRLG
jgi:hypothetical protein